MINNDRNTGFGGCQLKLINADGKISLNNLLCGLYNLFDRSANGNISANRVYCGRLNIKTFAKVIFAANWIFSSVYTTPAFCAA